MSTYATPIFVLLPAAITGLCVVLASCYFYYNYKKKQVLIPQHWKPVGRITKIFMYPLKSGHRLELNDADCTPYGLITTTENKFQLRDRLFVVYAEGTYEFKTARVYPKMVLIETSIHKKEYIQFDAPNQRPLYVKVPNPTKDEKVQIRSHKNEEIFGLDCGDEAAVWFSQLLLETTSGLRLAFHDGTFKRDITKVHKSVLKAFTKLQNEDAGLYSDLSSYLLVNQSSVESLNKNLEKPVSANHFRSNILVDGLENKSIPPFSEEDWDWIKIGSAIFRNVKPCTRCIMTTVDPETGFSSKTREPLKSLERLNTLKTPIQIEVAGQKPVMGINMGLKNVGHIALGDTVYISVDNQ